jgi:Cyclin, N-terminal domain
MSQSATVVDTDSLLDTLEAMRKQEESGYRTGDYLHQQQQVLHPLTGPQQQQNLMMGVAPPVDMECRSRMVEWCYQIVDFCKFKRETVSVSMSYLDRFLASPAGLEILLDRSKFQLAAMTALYTAIKIHEPEAMDPGLIASLSRGAYNKEQVEAMECAMLSAIQWRVNPPTALAFCHQYLNLIPTTLIHQDAREAILDLAKYQTELAVSDYTLCVASPSSSVAFAALLNALESMGMEADLFLKIESGLSRAARINLQSAAIRDIRIRLYESITNQPGSGQVYQNMVPPSSGSPDENYSTKTQTCVYGSPRSVSEAAATVC